MYAPKSVLYICVEPVSMAVPVVAAIFKKTHWYHPGRIIGSVAFHQVRPNIQSNYDNNISFSFQVRLNSLLAFHNDLDPSGVHVPLVGGPDIDNLVPLFSRATPIGTTPCEARGLTVRFKNLPDHENVMFEKDKLEFADLEPSSHAYALNRAITAMALGLLGDPEADMTAFIRSNVLPTCK